MWREDPQTPKTMETQYSGHFLSSLVELIQNISHNHLNFLNLNDSIEINGYISVEIDNVKKERYVLSETIWSSGSVVSESFCVKSGKRFAENPEQTKTSLIVRRGLVKRCSNTEEASTMTTSKKMKYCDVIEIDDDYRPQQPVPETSSQSGHQIQTERPVPHHSQSHQREKTVDEYSSQSGQQIQTESSIPQYSSQSHRHVRREKPVHQYSSQSNQQIQRESPVPPYSSQSHHKEHCQEMEISTKTKSKRRSNTYKSEVRRAVSQVASGPAHEHDNAQMNVSSLEPKFSYGSITNEKQDDVLQYSDDALTGNGSNMSRELQNMYDTAVSAVHSETPCSFSSQTDEEAPSNNYVCGSQDNSSPLEFKPCVKIEQAEEDFNSEVIDVDLFEGLDDDYSSMHESYSMAGDRPAPLDTGFGQKQSVISPGTNYVIRSAVKQFKRFFLETYSQDIDMFSLSSQELAASLLDFYQNVRKKNGEKPSARSLHNMHNHFNMYLKDGGSPIFITRDEDFRSCRNYIKSNMDEMGKQQKIQKFVPVDDSDVEQLFQTFQLGGHSQEAILNTMWFINSKYMGIKRPMDHLNLKWGDITLQTNKQGLEFLEHVMSDVFSFKIHAKPTNPTRCFVNIYKQYLKARPPSTLEAGYPFYLNYSKFSPACEYFQSDAMTWGRHTTIWKRMITGGQLDINKRVTC